jgi:hypothetical protein
LLGCPAPSQPQWRRCSVPCNADEITTRHRLLPRSPHTEQQVWRGRGHPEGESRSACSACGCRGCGATAAHVLTDWTPACIRTSHTEHCVRGHAAYRDSLAGNDLHSSLHAHRARAPAAIKGNSLARFTHSRKGEEKKEGGKGKEGRKEETRRTTLTRLRQRTCARSRGFSMMSS